MLIGILAVGALCALQLRCCLRAKRKLIKALPLLLDIILIGMLIIVLPEEAPDVLVYSFFACLLALLGFILAWPIYGAILRLRGQGNKVLGWSLAIVLLLAGTVMVWWHETPDWYAVSFGSVPEEVDRLEVYTFDYSEENRRLIRTVTDPKRIERYKNAPGVDRTGREYLRKQDQHQLLKVERIVVVAGE